MSNEPAFHQVYRSINTPLTIWGAERRLFFLAAVTAAGTFNFFGSVLGGLVMFAALYAFARWATVTDPQILRIVFSASRSKTCNDAGKRDADFRQEVTARG